MRLPSRFFSSSWAGKNGEGMSRSTGEPGYDLDCPDVGEHVMEDSEEVEGRREMATFPPASSRAEDAGLDRPHFHPHERLSLG